MMATSVKYFQLLSHRTSKIENFLKNNLVGVWNWHAIPYLLLTFANIVLKQLKLKSKYVVGVRAQQPHHQYNNNKRHISTVVWNGWNDSIVAKYAQLSIIAIPIKYLHFVSFSHLFKNKHFPCSSSKFNSTFSDANNFTARNKRLQFMLEFYQRIQRIQRIRMQLSARRCIVRHVHGILLLWTQILIVQCVRCVYNTHTQ